VIRENGPDLEAFCVLRHTKSSFLGGAVVFPGGKVETADGDDAWADHITTPHPRCTVFATEAVPARALCVAACREMLEEGGILPADAPFDAAEIDAIRAEPSLAAALAGRGRKLSLGALVPWARWITPEAESRRYDTRFFLLELPPGQVGRHDDHETTMSFWARPADVLDRFTKGELFLAPPTTRTLELLADARSYRQAVSIADEQALEPVCPTFVMGDPPFLALPGDPAHEVRERRVSGPTRFVLRDGRFVSGATEGDPGFSRRST
jgi:8-oxo-dGTP pyrophosphatase MutT (NUDIX family)